MRILCHRIVYLGLSMGLVSMFMFPSDATATTQVALFLSPQSGTFLVGSTFELSVVLDTKGVAVNTVEVELLFPADKIQLASPSVGYSIVQVWPAPPAFSNQEGKIYFIGGIPAPGIVTSQGVVLTLTFRVVAPGDAEIKFGQKSSALANDGQGTNVLRQRPSAFFKFQVPSPQGPAISSPNHPDQERWYRDTNPVFIWSKTAFASGYSYSIDRDPAGFSDTDSEGTIPTASFQDLDNGIWYFHLRERAANIWGGVSHYIVKIDGAPPAAFRIQVSPARRTTNANPIFRFFTTDALSGLDHFEMKVIPLSQGVQESLFFEVSSPYQAINLKEGRHQIIVRALDSAGNARDEAVTVDIVGVFSRFFNPEGVDLGFAFVPWAKILAGAGSLSLGFLIVLLFFWRRHRHHIAHAFWEDFGSLKKTKEMFGRFNPNQDRKNKS